MPRKCSTRDAEGNKRCARCRVFKPIAEFAINEYRKSVPLLRSYCRECAKVERSEWYHARGGATWHKRYRKEKPEALNRHARKHHLKKNYGLSVQEYDQILADQEGHCALCPRQPKKKRLAVDHDHKTGKRRGLLCSLCNPALGAFHDDPVLLRKAADYLERYT